MRGGDFAEPFGNEPVLIAWCQRGSCPRGHVLALGTRPSVIVAHDLLAIDDASPLACSSGAEPSRGGFVRRHRLCEPDLSFTSLNALVSVLVRERLAIIDGGSGVHDNLRRVTMTPVSTDDRDESRRAVARRERRTAGDRSARVAHELMKVPASTLDKLELDEDLRAEVDRARAVSSNVARRRAERTLAGALRRVDLLEIARALASIETTGVADTQLFHLAEQWRTKLLEEGLAAAETFPGGAADPLPLLLQNARRERDSGKPPGAARSLFRHVLATLKDQRAATAAAALREGDDDDAGAVADADADAADGDGDDEA